MSDDSINSFILYFSTVGSIITGFLTYTHAQNYFHLKNLKEMSVSELSTSKSLSSPICVSGSVSTHNMFDSRTSKEDLIVVYSNYIDARYPQFYSLKKPISSINKKSIKEFSLKEGKHEIFIQPTDETNINVLRAYNQSGEISMSFWTAIKSLISSLFLFTQQFYSWRVEAYQRVVEDVIPKDSDICVIGEVKKISNKLIIIPDYIAYSKSIILNSKKPWMYMLCALQLVFGVLLIGSLSEAQRRRRMRRGREEINRENAVRMAPGFQCCICAINPRNVITEPCKHLSTCLNCCANLDACPICQAPINERTRIYLT
ncbi:unnamed protein product [Blepharisma stoltei]|uniref:RING-type domain-containing protein n=1 Tax=Blepharisma stoltei TaxID=1481888 RepID=A0AAU9JC53_9CILI|nr:unnamed protein product [Blepharisma stoltei]